MNPSEAAPAKINLALHVMGRRDDGYHLLDSLVVFADLGETVEAAPAQRLTLTLSGPFAAALTDAPDDNLVLRAASRLSDQAGSKGVALHLTKTMPVASGIGGGSADAAAALRLLNRFWDCRLSGHDLAEIGAPLGADVPMCVDAVPMRVGGIGEIRRPVRFEFAPAMVLVNPLIAVPTPRVFGALERTQGSGLPDLPSAFQSAEQLAAWLGAARNDLQDPAIGLCPQIEQTLAALSADPDCLTARMSGSGATCFGLYADLDRAQAAASTLRQRMPRWWVKSVQARQD